MNENENTYATRSEFELRKQTLDLKLAALEKRLDDLDKNITHQFSFWGVLTVVTAIVITIAIFAVPIVTAHL